MAASPPSQSSLPVCDGSRLSGTYRQVSQSATAAMGRLIQKAARQVIVSMRKPPSGGPSAVVTAEAAAQVPMARPRTDFGKQADMMARLLRHEQRRADALHDAGGNQHADIRRHGAAERGDREDDDTGEEDVAAA